MYLLALGDNNFAVLNPSVQLFQVELASDYAYRACDGQGLCHNLAGTHRHVVPAILFGINDCILSTMLCRVYILLICQNQPG